jgi:uncharacterized protein YbjT (DUF2867 family)
MTSESATFAVLGATGLIGNPIALSVIAEGHRLVAITRGRTTRNAQKLDALERAGGLIRIAHVHDVDGMARAFADVDIVVSLLHGTAAVIGVEGPLVLDAAIRSGRVRRFLLDEFGCDTMSMPSGMGRLFDAKKEMQEKARASGLAFTAIFPGLIHNYSLPNLREFKAITTYGYAISPVGHPAVCEHAWWGGGWGRAA